MKVALPVAAVGVAVAIWMGTRAASTGTEQAPSVAAAQEDALDRLVVLPLRNLTTDPELDVWGTLAADQMARAVDQAGPVAVVPSATVTDAIRSLGDAASTDAVAAAVQATHVFAGTVARIGDQIRFEVELLDVRSGERQRTLEPVVGSVDATETLVAALAQQAATVAVAHLDPDAPPWVVADFSVPISVTAYQDYLEQIDLFCSLDYRGSIDAAKRSLARSPEYVPAMQMMMTAYSNLGMDAEADSLIAVLEQLRDGMTRMERLELDWMTGNRTDDPEMAERAAEEMYRLDPSGISALIAMMTAWNSGRMGDAIERLEHMDLDGPCPWIGAWTQGSVGYHALGRYEEELELARHGLGYYRDRRSLMDIEIRALAGMGRLDAVDSVLNVMAGLPPQAGSAPYLRPLRAGLELRAHGHDDAAERAFDRAMEGLASVRPEQGRNNRGQIFYYTGRWEDADTVYASLLSESPANIGYLGRRGAALARLGRRDEAMEMSARLGRVTGPDISGAHIRWQAIIAAALGDRDDAVRLLQEGFENDLSHGTWIHREPAFDGMWGYAPFEALLAPR